jgi:hypothetical protein
LEYDNLTNNRILLLDSGVEYNYLSKWKKVKNQNLNINLGHF